MSGFSNYLSQRVISATVGSAGGSGGSNLVPPTALYLALFSADPTDANVTANELATGSWYERQPTGSWSVPGVGVITTSNSNQIIYNAVTGSAVTVTHWGIYDAASSGNLLYSGAVGTTKTFNVGDVPVIAAGTIVLTVD